MGHDLILGAKLLYKRLLAKMEISYDDQVDVVATAWYIYLIAGFVYLVLAAVGAAARQYYLAIKSRSASKDDVWPADLEQIGSFRAGSFRAGMKRRISAVTNSVSLSLPVIRKRIKRGDFDGFAEIPTNVNFSEDSSIKNLVSRVSDSKLVYAIDQLRQFDGQNQPQMVKNNTVKLCNVLQYSVTIPPYDCLSVYAANKAIVEVKKGIFGDLVDPTSVALHIITLLHLGKPKDDTNSCFFLYSFNQLVEELVEPKLEAIVKFTKIPTLKILIYEMIIIYCWHHWMFINAQDLPLIQQNRFRVFRIMCNLKLHMGLSELKPVEKSNLELKYHVVAREMFRLTRCYEYLELIPMIAEMMDKTMQDSARWLFLDLLQELIDHHGECCMGDYLGDTLISTILAIGAKGSQRLQQKTDKLRKCIQGKRSATPVDFRPTAPGGWQR